MTGVVWGVDYQHNNSTALGQVLEAVVRFSKNSETA